MDDVTKLQSALTHITGLYERAESRVASLEEERARLEAEAKELERSLSRSIHEPSSSTSVHRQVGQEGVEWVCVLYIQSVAVRSYLSH